MPLNRIFTFLTVYAILCCAFVPLSQSGAKDDHETTSGIKVPELPSTQAIKMKMDWDSATKRDPSTSNLFKKNVEVYDGTIIFSGDPVDAGSSGEETVYFVNGGDHCLLHVSFKDSKKDLWKPADDRDYEKWKCDN